MPANRPLVIPVKPWRPDLAAFGSQATITVSNVLPRTKTSYGPFPDLTSIGVTALPLRCQGALGAADTSGVVSVFAGTATDLYQATVGSTSFTNVSKSAAAYTCGADQFWNFAIINDRVVATNIADPIQSFVFSSSTKFANLSADAPKAKYCAGVKQWLMVANTNDPTGGVAPWRVWWSAINDPTSWPTPGSSAAVAVQSDYQDTVGEGGAIQGLVGNLGAADAALFFERAVWRILYQGPPQVFNFFPAEGVRGTPAPKSIIQVGSLVYYLADDGFYVFDGATSVPIGVNKIDKTFYADLDQSYVLRVVGSVDPINKMVFWAYPGSGHIQGNPNRIIVYNWVTQEWSIASTTSEYIFRTLTFGYTLEGLDAVSSSLDALPFSLDSRAWAGGVLQLAGFNTSHELCFFSGSTLAPTVDTDEMQPFNGQRAFIRNTRPLVDGGTPSVAIGTRETTESSVTYNMATAINTLGWSPQRATGRYIRARITLPAGSSFSHIQGVELDCDPCGVR